MPVGDVAAGGLQDFPGALDAHWVLGVYAFTGLNAQVGEHVQWAARAGLLSDGVRDLGNVGKTFCEGGEVKAGAADNDRGLIFEERRNLAEPVADGVKWWPGMWP